MWYATIKKDLGYNKALKKGDRVRLIDIYRGTAVVMTEDDQIHHLLVEDINY
jgi:hypothetical protein